MADDPINDVVSSEDDDDDDDENEQQRSLNDVVSPSPSPLPSTPPSATAAVTSTPPPPPPKYTSVTVALSATPERKPIDDSRRLFQRLWTDEDEIELLQGYLEYSASRGGGGHHHDTTAFYELIKNKLQLEFNKNQLVEKLRRLKKKYRNVISKMSSGKDFVFKSPHDHATFEISRKIWSNLSGSVEFDDADHNPNPNPNLISSGSGASGGLMKLSTTRKRLRESGKVEDKFVKIEGGIINNNNHNNINNDINKINVVSNDNVKNVGLSSPLQGFVEETIKNYLSPVLKDLINNTINGGNNASQSAGVVGGGSPGFKGVGELALNAIPLNFPGVNVEGGMDERWRKQQIIELEVYSKRLELVQDQIKTTLDELRSIN
ncbi:hypothetical protein RND81_04G199400 [Saponaria officinalis]|uniref:Glabrous enhancer-binding protein-like DBD domain-containing protein n=1 Tax=Saponaria officinalis TaxID=3572 RepID=A0AAW1LQX7_SAPOF